MLRFSEITAKRAWIGLALLAAGGIASVIVAAVGNSGLAPAPIPSVSPAEAVASRFPPAWNDSSATVLRTGFDTQADPQDQRLALFNPNPTLPPPAWSLPQSAWTNPMTPAPDVPNAGAGPRNTSRTNALFNEAQIAAIKNRLNLTRSQMQYWPAVESALRDIAWEKPASKSAKRTIDPNSRGVQRLKSAAAALVPTLNDEQKRELRLLAGLIGMQNVAAQF
jgi:hypothetical protein